MYSTKVLFTYLPLVAETADLAFPGNCMQYKYNEENGKKTKTNNQPNDKILVHIVSIYATRMICN